MASKELISIIIPIHNAQKYLEECVDSVLSQTYNNLEILLIDDNSSDSSFEIINKFAKKDDRVRIFSQVGGSAGQTRNFGLDRARGSYISFVDADDKLAPENLDKLHQALDGVQTGFSISKFTTNEAQLGQSSLQEQLKIYSKDFLSKLKGIQESGYPSFGPIGKLYTRDIFEELRYPDFKIHEDTAIILPIIDKAESVVLVSSVDYYYRMTPDSITHSKISQSNFSIFDKNQIQINFSKNKHPESLHYIYQLCMNENDYIAMKCMQDNSTLSRELFEKLFSQNKSLSQITGIRKILYKNKSFYKLYIKSSTLLWNNDLIRGLAKKIVT